MQIYYNNNYNEVLFSGDTQNRSILLKPHKYIELEIFMIGGGRGGGGGGTGNKSTGGNLPGYGGKGGDGGFMLPVFSLFVSGVTGNVVLGAGGIGGIKSTSNTLGGFGGETTFLDYGTYDSNRISTGVGDFDSGSNGFYYDAGGVPYYYGAAGGAGNTSSTIKFLGGNRLGGNGGVDNGYSGTLVSPTAGSFYGAGGGGGASDEWGTYTQNGANGFSGFVCISYESPTKLAVGGTSNINYNGRWYHLYITSGSFTLNLPENNI